MKVQKVTLKDISKKLNVSTTTVANALNGNPNISDGLRRTIIREAEELGYKPNISAKAMSKKGLSIALFMSEEPVEYNKYLMNGIYEMIAGLSDFKITVDEYLYHDNTSADEALDCIKRLAQFSYDGIVFGKSFESESYMSVFREYIDAHPNTKIVYLNDDIIDDDIPYSANVSSNAAITGRVVCQLIGLMHPGGAKVGIITTSQKFDSHQIILDSFKRDSERYGIKILDIMYNNDNKSGTYACTGSLIDRHPDIDLIYITSYDSLSVCRCIENRGLARKIRVIGHDIYDDILPYFDNGLLIASVFQNQKKIGSTLIQLLINAIMGIKIEEEEIFIRPEIILSSNCEEYLRELNSIKTNVIL